MHLRQSKGSILIDLSDANMHLLCASKAEIIIRDRLVLSMCELLFCTETRTTVRKTVVLEFVKLFRMTGVEGLEPPTHGLEIRCSIRLSYTPGNVYSWMISTSPVQVKSTGDGATS